MKKLGERKFCSRQDPCQSDTRLILNQTLKVKKVWLNSMPAFSIWHFAGISFYEWAIFHFWKFVALSDERCVEKISLKRLLYEWLYSTLLLFLMGGIGAMKMTGNFSFSLSPSMDFENQSWASRSRDPIRCVGEEKKTAAYAKYLKTVRRLENFSTYSSAFSCKQKKVLLFSQ